MKKTVKIHLSILLALILLFLPVGNISVIQAASNKSLNEVKNYISSQYDSTISVSDSKGNKFSIIYDKKKDTLSFSSDITNDGVSITVNLTAKSNLKGKSDISVTFNTDYSNIKGSAKKKVSKIGLSSTKFKTQIEGVNAEDSDIQSLMNEMLDFSLSVWQKLLIYKTDYRLKDIGFKKLKKLKVAKVKTGANAENQPSYDYEDQVIHHDGYCECADCGAHFATWQEANSHMMSTDHDSGWTEYGAWDEQVTEQVPHTKTKFSDGTRIIHHDGVHHDGYMFDDDYYTESVADRNAYSDSHEDLGWHTYAYDEPAWDEIIFPAKVWDKVFSVDTPGVKFIHHDGEWICRTCGATFTTDEAAGNHCWENDDCFDSGYTGSPGWDEIVKVQQ